VWRKSEFNASLSSSRVAARPGLPTVGFGEAISRGFTNYFTFSGKASRPEYWWWVLFTALVAIIPLSILVTFIPSLAVTSRRLHDIGKSGWLQILPFAFIVVTFISIIVSVVGGTPRAVGWIIFAIASSVVLFVLLASKGDEGPNKSDPDPRQATSGELPMIDFGKGIVLGLQNCIKFSGRATSAEFWWFALFYGLLQIGNLIIGILPFIGWIVELVVTLVFLIPLISVSVRRLHDIGRSGWWVMVWFPAYSPVIIPGILLLISLYVDVWSGDNLLEIVLISSIVNIVAGVGLAIWCGVWFCNKGHRGPNKYGPDPRQTTSQQPYRP